MPAKFVTLYILLALNQCKYIKCTALLAVLFHDFETLLKMYMQREGLKYLFDVTCASCHCDSIGLFAYAFISK
jgi:hypothetical protein